MRTGRNGKSKIISSSVDSRLSLSSERVAKNFFSPKLNAANKKIKAAKLPRTLKFTKYS